MDARAPMASETRWATTSEVASRAASMSCRAIWESAISGKLRMSVSRRRAKTVLPAPMKAILAIAGLSSFGRQLQQILQEPRRQRVAPGLHVKDAILAEDDL